MGEKAGVTLDRLPVCERANSQTIIRANTHTYSQIQITN